MYYLGSEQREGEILDVEPAGDFIRKIGRPTEYGRVEVNLFDAGPLTHGRVVVDRTQLELLAAQLAAEGEAHPEIAHLYREFVEIFPGIHGGRFVGPSE